jgi:hypothetical protein
MITFLAIVSVLLGFIAFIVAWKTFNWFFWTRSDSYRLTKADYFVKKLWASAGSALVVGFLANGFLMRNLIGERQPSPPVAEIKLEAAPHAPSASTENIHPHQELVPANIADPTKAEVEAIDGPIAKDKGLVQQRYSDAEVKAMEDAAQYHGDDPIVRARLGLPPVSDKSAVGSSLKKAANSPTESGN